LNAAEQHISEQLLTTLLLVLGTWMLASLLATIALLYRREL
jgi:hypothetical protein